jgi:hypothetical protein
MSNGSRLAGILRGLFTAWDVWRGRRSDLDRIKTNRRNAKERAEEFAKRGKEKSE